MMGQHPRFVGIGVVIGPVALLSTGALCGTTLSVAPGGLPIGYPPLTVPSHNRPSAAKVALGRRLFFERRLSVDGTISCADCHKRENGFADSVPISRGVFGRRGIRKTPSLLNVGYRPTLMWDGRAADLEDQMRLPLTNREEMGASEASAVAMVQVDRSYIASFAAAFGDGEVSLGRISQAIATFERVALLGGNSPFDRFMFAGDARAISASAQRGWHVFQSKGCISCHHVEGGNPLFTDFQFHNIGIGYDTMRPDLGRYNVTMAPADRGKFKTPSLVGVADHAPYMHDGRFQTLGQVIDYYDRGGEQNPFLDAQMKPLKLTAQNKTDLIAFLRELSPGLASSKSMIASARGLVSDRIGKVEALDRAQTIASGTLCAARATHCRLSTTNSAASQGNH